MVVSMTHSPIPHQEAGRFRAQGLQAKAVKGFRLYKGLRVYIRLKTLVFRDRAQPRHAFFFQLKCFSKLYCASYLGSKGVDSYQEDPHKTW